MVVALAELFAVFGSDGDVDATETVFVICPFFVGLTLIVTVTVPPLAIVPRLHETVAFSGFSEHVPWVVDVEPYPAFLGSWSVAVTPVAASGPLFVTFTV